MHSRSQKLYRICQAPVLYGRIEKRLEIYCTIMRWTEADNMCNSVNRVFIRKEERRLEKSTIWEENFRMYFTCSKKPLKHSSIWSSLSNIDAINTMVTCCMKKYWCESFPVNVYIRHFRTNILQIFFKVIMH